MNLMFIHNVYEQWLFTINDHSRGYEQWSLWSMIILIHAWMCCWLAIVWCMKNVDHGMNRLLFMHDNIHIHVIMNIIVTPTFMYIYVPFLLKLIWLRGVYPFKGLTSLLCIICASMWAKIDMVAYAFITFEMMTSLHCILNGLMYFRRINVFWLDWLHRIVHSASLWAKSVTGIAKGSSLNGLVGLF